MDFTLDTPTLLSYASEASAFSGLINFQAASSSSTRVAVRNPETVALPAFDPAAGQAAALAGAALSDSRYIARRKLGISLLDIETDDFAVHSLISRSDWQDAARNPDSSVDIDELVRRDVAAQTARTLDALVIGTISAAPEVEYVDDFAATLEAAMSQLEDDDIDATDVILPKRVRTYVRAQKANDGSYLFDPVSNTLLGMTVRWVSNNVFPTATDMGVITNALYFHGAMVPTDSPRVLHETYAHAGQVAVENWVRAGAVVLDPGTGVPAVRIVNEA